MQHSLDMLDQELPPVVVLLCSPVAWASLSSVPAEHRKLILEDLYFHRKAQEQKPLQPQHLLLCGREVP